jgi:cytoskeletal protein RodZ
MRGGDSVAMPAEEPKQRRLRAPSPRRFAAAATASFVAVFGVLALRLHDGADPAFQSASSPSKANTTASQTTTTDSSSSTSDPYSTSSSSTSSDDSSSSSSSSDQSSSGVSSTPSASTSAS